MADTAGSEALAAIDRVLADRPNKVGHDFSVATRHLAIWRDALAQRWRQSAAEIDRRGMGPNGPARLDHRYVLEDAPFGLVFTEALAGIAGVDTPALSACITLLETAYERDFRGANFLVRALGLADTDASALRMRCAAASSVATGSRLAPAAR